jgi:hypothetical protein
VHLARLRLLTVRVVFASFLLVAAALPQAPVRAADLAGVWASAVHAEPFMVYDYDPGIVARAYWLPPWGGRHYFPSSGKAPVIGRHERLGAAPVADKKNYIRDWASFPVDTIEQPPLILNQQQILPPPVGAAPPSNPPALK